MYIMKEFIFNFVWAALVALLTVMGLVWLNNRIISLDEWLFFPSIISFLHNHGMSVKTVLFFMLFFLYWINSWHHVISGVILKAIKFILSIIFTVIAVILGIIAIYLGYHFLIWLASVAF